MSKFCSDTSVASWARRTAISIAATIAVTAVGGAPAHASTVDTDGPEIVSSWVSHPQVIDVVDGPAQVTARIEVRDLGTGLAPGYPQLDAHSNGYIIPAQTMTLISGDRFRGTYETTFTFPEYVPRDLWEFAPRIVDLAGNGYTGDFLPFFPTTVSLVDNDAPDVSASVNIKFANIADGPHNVIDITDGPVPASMTVSAQDAGIGFRRDASIYIGPYLRRNSSTDPHRAVFTGSYEYAKYNGDPNSLGQREVWSPRVADANGNTAAAYKLEDVIMATRPLRAKRPDVRVGAGIVTAAWTANPDVLGILEYETEFSGTGTQRTVRSTGTEASLSDLPAGTYTARVRARNQLGWGEWTTSSLPVVYTLSPMTSSTPVVTGTVKVGQTLTANPGAWTPGTTLAYEWLAGGVAVSGATGSTLVLEPSNIGKAIAVRVTGIKQGYLAASRTSAATSTVAAGTLAGAIPSFTGAAQVGATLSVNTGAWSPAPVSVAYQWYRSGTAVPGSTAATYKLSALDLGRTIKVKVTATKLGYAAVSQSAATPLIAKGTLVSSTPVISGTPTAGRTLTAMVGSWSYGTSFKYQWYRSGVALDGATAKTYVLTAGDRSRSFKVLVTGFKSGYTTVKRFSAITLIR